MDPDPQHWFRRNICQCIVCSIGSCQVLLMTFLTWIPTIQLPVSRGRDERFSLLPEWLPGSTTLTSQVKDKCSVVDPRWFRYGSGSRDTALNLNTDPDPLSQPNVYPCGSKSGSKFHHVEFLHEKYKLQYVGTYR